MIRDDIFRRYHINVYHAPLQITQKHNYQQKGLKYKTFIICDIRDIFISNFYKINIKK